MTEEIAFEVMSIEKAADVARLHIEGIKTGFISSMGDKFVTALYEAIAKDKSSFGFVAEKNDKILGFIAFTTNLNQLYRSVIWRKGLKFTFLLVDKIFSLKQIKKVFETLFYPSKIKKINLPSAELLSIVIAEQERGKGLATTLMQKGFAECAQRGIEKVKVLVGADNKPAAKLYSRCGFKLLGQIDSHGVPSNIYVAHTC